MVLTGNGVSPGIAVGTIHIHRKPLYEPTESFITPEETPAHIDRYEAVKKLALDELEKIRLTVEKNDPEQAGIFSAHQDIVNDIVINDEIPHKIRHEHWSGDWAIYNVYHTYLCMVRQAPDPLIAERAADFEDVRGRLLRLWYGRNEESAAMLTGPVIIAAHDLLPSDTAVMDENMVLAILAETGGATSHSAIIARSYGIPAVLGIPGLLEAVKDGQRAAVNAGDGIVELEPDETTVKDFERKSAAFRRKREQDKQFRNREACTADGVNIEIGLNIANADDKELQAAEYTDSAGLFRTEFLYMGRSALPDEEEQFSVYRKVLERFGKRPVILRTLDIGGDKPAESMNLPHEANPFLGNRALRLCFSRPDLFAAQIRACLRAAVYGNLWIMLPMVNSLDDIRRAKKIINVMSEDMRKEGIPCGEIKTGIMIEIPSIALMAASAAQEVDFASIGSNDLCQYLCAADRTNSAVEPYYQMYHPALLKIMSDTVNAFVNAGKPISICGELGGDPLAVPILIGFGMRKLSMGSASVAEIKRIIAALTIAKAEEMAKTALGFATAGEVKDFLAAQQKLLSP